MSPIHLHSSFKGHLDGDATLDIVSNQGRDRHQIRLGPGAVMGSYGDGFILVESQILNVPESANEDTAFNQVMPETFDFERYTAIDPEVDETLKEAIQQTEGLKKSCSGRSLVTPGMPVDYKSIVTAKNGQRISGEMLTIMVHPLDADEGYDVELDLGTYTPSAE